MEMGGQLHLPVPSVAVTLGLEARLAPIGGLGVMVERKNPSPVGKQTSHRTRVHSLTELPELIKRIGNVNT